MSGQKMKIGEILVKAGVINSEQLRDVLHSQSQLGGTLGENMVRLGFIGEEDLLQFLSEQMGFQYINLEKLEIPVSVQRLINAETVRLHRLLPIGFEGKSLVVGMVDPTNMSALSDVEFKTGQRNKAVILSAHQFEQAMDFFEAHGYGAVTLKLESGKDTVKEQISEGGGSNLADMLSTLISWKGQDLLLSANAVPAVRVDNEMRRLNMPAMKPSEIEQMIMAILSPEQKRAFQTNMELGFALSMRGMGRFRCNVYRQRNSMAFIARYISETIPSAQELGLPNFMKEFALKHQGLILVVGPSGHGKSTTVAWIVDTINNNRKANIITLEDPVEFTFAHKNCNVNQREVGTDVRSFEDGLRSVFRYSPDVIVVSEFRDCESVSIALDAAEAGHLVIGTMRSTNTTAAVDSIVDLFPADRHAHVRWQLSECLQLVFSQWLLKRAGGAGRVMAWEKMTPSHRIRNSIREGKVHQLRNVIQSNMEELIPIDYTLADLAASGKVKYEEAAKFADSVTYLNDLMKQKGNLK